MTTTTPAPHGVHSFPNDPLASATKSSRPSFPENARADTGARMWEKIESIILKEAPINPYSITHGSNIRDVDYDWVKKLKKDIADVGWNPSSRIYVVRISDMDSVPHIDSIEDGAEFYCIDGMHRVMALREYLDEGNTCSWKITVLARMPTSLMIELGWHLNEANRKNLANTYGETLTVLRRHYETFLSTKVPELVMSLNFRRPYSPAMFEVPTKETRRRVSLLFYEKYLKDVLLNNRGKAKTTIKRDCKIMLSMYNSKRAWTLFLMLARKQETKTIVSRVGIDSSLFLDAPEEEQYWILRRMKEDLKKLERVWPSHAAQRRSKYFGMHTLWQFVEFAIRYIGEANGFLLKGHQNGLALRLQEFLLNAPMDSVPLKGKGINIHDLPKVLLEIVQSSSCEDSMKNDKSVNENSNSNLSKHGATQNSAIFNDGGGVLMMNVESCIKADKTLGKRKDKCCEVTGTTKQTSFLEGPEEKFCSRNPSSPEKKAESREEQVQKAFEATDSSGVEKECHAFAGKTSSKLNVRLCTETMMLLSAGEKAKMVSSFEHVPSQGRDCVSAVIVKKSEIQVNDEPNSGGNEYSDEINLASENLLHSLRDSQNASTIEKDAKEVASKFERAKNTQYSKILEPEVELHMGAKDIKEGEFNGSGSGQGLRNITDAALADHAKCRLSEVGDVDNSVCVSDRQNALEERNGEVRVYPLRKNRTPQNFDSGYSSNLQVVSSKRSLQNRGRRTKKLKIRSGCLPIAIGCWSILDSSSLYRFTPHSTIRNDLKVCYEKHYVLQCSKMSTFCREMEERLTMKVDLLLTSHPYCLLKEPHDTYSKSDMKDFTAFANKVIRESGSAIIFCSEKQISNWINYLSDAGFQVGRNIIHIIRKSAGGEILSGYSKNMVEYAVVAQRSSVNGCSAHAKRHINWHHKGFGFIPSTYMAHENVIDQYESPKTLELLSLERHSLRAQQKSGALMKEIISRYSNPGALVCDPFGGVYTTSVAALITGRRFIGCELDEKLHEAGTKRMFEIFSRFCEEHDPRVMHNPDSLITSLGAVDAVIGTVNSPPWVGSVVNQSFEKQRERDCHHLRLRIGKSKITGANLGLFATEPILAGQPFAPYWGTLISDRFRDDEKYYPEAFTEEEQDRAMQLKVIPGTKNGVTIVGSLGCAATYANDAYKSEYENNSEYRERNLLDDARDIKESKLNALKIANHDFLMMVTTRNINADEEILGPYGSKFWTEKNNGEELSE